MDTTTGTLTEACNMVFKTIHENYRHKDSMSILMSHSGVFSQDLINSLAEGAEEIMISANEKRPLIRRMFSILIEGLQNIRTHGERDLAGIQHGLLVFAKGDGFYRMTLGNLIRNENRDSMESRLDELNSLSAEDLKSRYMTVLSNRILSNKGGAGLGFITIRIKSNSTLNFAFHPVSDELSLFTFELNIEKPVSS